MAASSKKSNGPVLPIRSCFQHSLSPPSGRFSSAAGIGDKTGFASSTSSSFCSSPANGFMNRSTNTGFLHRSTSPTRVSLHGFAPLAPVPSVRFSIGRSLSPHRSMAISSRDQVFHKQNGGNTLSNLPKKTCLCAPTTHPGSFRCSLHKKVNNTAQASYFPSRLNARRSAMTNSLVRIGTVEGDLVKRALAALIRPSSHQQRRRSDFQPRPSRLSKMSKTDEQ
ncbi:unnamed protein product [Cuscuta europaea]|uniref:Serine-rich protein-like protein n=1 Tax=Cuscuta europaea TaxID=41803 RepID=A0A9P1EEK2_CUSEU|nr:unnamed protein product [Cuscuta europaea]